MMRARNILGNTQAQSRAWNVSLYRRAPVQPLKDPALFLSRNSAAIIGDRDGNLTRAIPHLNQYRLRRRRVFESVVQELLDRQPHEMPVHHNSRKIFITNDVYRTFVDLIPHRPDDFSNNIFDVSLFSLDANL